MLWYKSPAYVYTTKGCQRNGFEEGRLSCQPALKLISKEKYNSHQPFRLRMKGDFPYDRSTWFFPEEKKEELHI